MAPPQIQDAGASAADARLSIANQIAVTRALILSLEEADLGENDFILEYKAKLADLHKQLSELGDANTSALPRMFLLCTFPSGAMACVYAATDRPWPSSVLAILC